MTNAPASWHGGSMVITWPPTPREFKFTVATTPDEVKAWLESHGHRALFGPPGDPEAPGGIVFDHGAGTSVQMAMPGDTLTVRPNGTIAVN